MKVFAGVRVLDLSRMLAGPYGSMLLADLGAEVIKIEDPDGGDPMRTMGPPYLPDGESAYFLAINRNKKSVVIDLTKSELDLLFFLVANKNRVVSKNAIGEHLSGDDADRLDNYDFVYSHIKNLKKKLAEAGSEDFIKTVYRLGYKFEV